MFDYCHMKNHFIFNFGDTQFCNILQLLPVIQTLAFLSNKFSELKQPALISQQ